MDKVWHKIGFFAYEWIHKGIMKLTSLGQQGKSYEERGREGQCERLQGALSLQNVPCIHGMTRGSGSRRKS